MATTLFVSHRLYVHIKWRKQENNTESMPNFFEEAKFCRKPDDEAFFALI